MPSRSYVPASEMVKSRHNFPIKITVESVCLLRYFNEKLFDEVFAVVGYSTEAFVVELPVASSHVV